MKLWIVFLLIVLSGNFISAVCNDGQIDINSASLSLLDNLTGIGPVYAQRIVDGRPFSSVDNLIDIKGIGDVTLQKIKDQGLACVEGNHVENEQEEEQEPEEIVASEDKNIEDDSKDLAKPYIPTQTYAEQSAQITGESIINLNSNSISEQEKDVVYTSKSEIIRKYSIYIFALFLVVIIIILIAKG